MSGAERDSLVRFATLPIRRPEAVVREVDDWEAFCRELVARPAKVTPGKRARKEEKDGDDSNDEDYTPSDEEAKGTKKVPKTPCAKRRVATPPPCPKRQKVLPYAVTTADYFQPGGTLKYRPRPEWWSKNGKYIQKRFKHRDTILLAAIRENATEAALALIELDRDSARTEPERNPNESDAAAAALRLKLCYNIPLMVATNEKGVTPLMLASQKGNLAVVEALLQPPLKVDPAAVAPGGTTAVLQAAHFGHVEILERLLLAGGDQLGEVANANGTSPLMRAAQEGHVAAVECLLLHGAAVNRENRLQMTALLLAAQRGQAEICTKLLAAGAHVHHKTAQNSTALHLACQRDFLDVVKVLLTAGCELYAVDREGRTALAVLDRHFRFETRRIDGGPEPTPPHQLIRPLLDPTVQVELMQQAARVERNRELMRLYALVQQQRAQVRVPNLYADEDVMMNVEDVVELYNHPPPSPRLSMRRMVEPPPPSQLPLPHSLTNPSTEALLRTMALPTPLVQIITMFLPAPKLWTKRIAMLQSTAFVNANAGIVNTLDLIDEVLEEGGFLTACDVAQVPAPLPHASWVDWKRSASSKRTAIGAPPSRSPRRVNVTEAMPPPPQDPAHPTIHEMRRQVGYLPLLAQYQFQSNLQAVLTAAPYRLPPHLMQQLLRTSDIASIGRRCGGGQNSVNFEAPAAMDIILLASRLCSWYWQERHDD